MENKKRKILFLDFDGVLHPSEVYRNPDGRIFLDPEFEDDGHFLFEHCNYLIKILEEVETVRPVEIILSTSWVEQLGGLEPAKAWLPPELQRRVVGAVWNGLIDVDDNLYTCLSKNRLIQIKRYCKSRDLKLDEWVAVDDSLDGWAVHVGYPNNLVLTNQYFGLGIKLVQDELIRKLKA